LPFLLKLLAAERPLSLQAHPSRAQAEAGFADEQSRGISLDSPERNFKDNWPKPEMIVALTPLEALSGFRDPVETLSLFEALGVNDDIVRPALGSLRFREGAAALAEAFLDCLTLDDTRQTILDEVLSAAVKHTDDAGEVGRFARLAVTLDGHYPGDPSLLAALLLNHVELAPGQGLHSTAGVLHSYLHGAGVEIMANSDNVLRAGLTFKHVDHAALTSIIYFEPRPPAVVDPVPDRMDKTAWRYPTADPEFTLWRLEPNPDAGATPLPGPGRARILMVIDGHIMTNAGSELLQGQAAFFEADEEPTITGNALAFLAAPGL
jgi:mannose-6-phosphate isomerase